MKCPKCRAEILSNTVKTCPYCSSPLAVHSEKGKEVERTVNREAIEVAEKIKEAIELQKAIYKPETVKVNEKPVKVEKIEKVEKFEEIEKEKYSASDIAILFVSITLTFIVLALTLSLILRR